MSKGADFAPFTLSHVLFLEQKLLVLADPVRMIDDGGPTKGSHADR